MRSMISGGKSVLEQRGVVLGGGSPMATHCCGVRIHWFNI